MNTRTDKKNLKVVILTEGGHNIGFGHISRCGSLYRAFEEAGHHPLFVVNGDASVTDLLEGKNHFLFNWMEEEPRLFSLLKEEQAQVVLIDSYLASQTFFKTLSQAAEIPIYLDDNKRMDYPPGVVLNWSVYAPDLAYPQDPNITYLLGPKYLSLRPAFDSIPPKVINDQISRIMVTMGGDDSKNLTPRILELLKELYPQAQKDIIIGKAFANIPQIQACCDNSTNLIYYPDAEGMKQVMLQSDLAVTSGGQTVYELARIGLPAVAVATAENQLNNVKTWEKIGFIRYAGFWTDTSLTANLKQCLQLLSPAQKRNQCSAIGKKQVGGHGEKNVVAAIECLRRPSGGPYAGSARGGSPWTPCKPFGLWVVAGLLNKELKK